jgi:hypothetical protein
MTPPPAAAPSSSHHLWCRCMKDPSKLHVGVSSPRGCHAAGELPIGSGTRNAGEAKHPGLVCQALTALFCPREPAATATGARPVRRCLILPPLRPLPRQAPRTFGWQVHPRLCQSRLLRDAAPDVPAAACPGLEDVRGRPRPPCSTAGEAAQGCGQQWRLRGDARAPGAQGRGPDRAPCTTICLRAGRARSARHGSRTECRHAMRDPSTCAQRRSSCGLLRPLAALLQVNMPAGMTNEEALSVLQIKPGSKPGFEEIMTAKNKLMAANDGNQEAVMQVGKRAVQARAPLPLPFPRAALLRGRRWRAGRGPGGGGGGGGGGGHWPPQYPLPPPPTHTRTRTRTRTRALVVAAAAAAD